MADTASYVFATPKPWHLAAFAARRESLPGAWSIVTTPRDLERALTERPPRYAFFPHWSHIVPEPLLAQVECVCFHMTDVPYGRGGSPLQNLIARGHDETRLSALRMTAELDAGPVYAKRPLSLEGSALEIFERAADPILDLIEWIVREEPTATAQEGAPTHFERRRPAQSELPPGGDLAALYDHIRMLDAPGYPPAFLSYGDWRIELDGASLDGDGVTARARISPTSGKGGA